MRDRRSSVPSVRLSSIAAACFLSRGGAPTGQSPADSATALSGVPAGAKVPPIPAGVISPAGWGALTTNDLTFWAGPWGVSFAANITPDKATGIGAWTEAVFVNTIRTGKHKGALRDLLQPMPWQSMSKLTDQDLKAIFAYLRSIKPIQNKVPDPRPPGQ